MEKEKTKKLKFRLSENDYEKIEDNYKKSIYPTRSEFIRQTLVNSEIKKYDYKFIDLYTFQIKKIGYNINQLVKKVYMSNYISGPDIHFVKKNMEDILDLQEKLEKEIKEILD